MHIIPYLAEIDKYDSTRSLITPPMPLLPRGLRQPQSVPEPRRSKPLLLPVDFLQCLFICHVRSVSIPSLPEIPDAADDQCDEDAEKSSGEDLAALVSEPLLQFRDLDALVGVEPVVEFADHDIEELRMFARLTSHGRRIADDEQPEPDGDHRIENEELTKAIDEILVKLIEEGSVQEVLDKYISAE